MHATLQSGCAHVQAPPPPRPWAPVKPRWCRCSAVSGRAESSSSAAQDTPLLDAVVERGCRKEEVAFHVPGHKRGAGTPRRLGQVLGAALQYDLTELDGLDVLSTPSGPIQAAQQLAARTWGADATWFLVNGTTAGIHAAVMATCGPGDALVLARNAHLSAFNAMVLAGCTPVYAQPSYDPRLGIAHHVTPAALAAAFEQAERRGLRVAAALVVSPTYFGVLSDTAGLAAVCHSRGVPLLVDEAHGAHLGLHPQLPPSALQGGADVAVQSTHKQLSAATQAAMLHVRGERVSRQRIGRALQVLQSSSPSYLLLASLDAARAQAAEPSAHDEAVRAALHARQQLQQLPGVQLLCRDGVAGADACAAGGVDPLRLTVSLQRLGLTGYQAADVLERQHGVVPELATPTCIVLALSIGSTHRDALALVAALQHLCRQHAGAACSSSDLWAEVACSALAAPPEVLLPPRDAFFAAAEAVPAAQAVGRASAELLCPYPPGVPAVYPGEAITAQALQQLHAVLRQGGKVTGCSDSTLQTLRVIVGA